MFPGEHLNQEASDAEKSEAFHSWVHKDGREATQGVQTLSGAAQRIEVRDLVF